MSFDIPEYTGDVTALGTTRLLDAIRESGIPARFYNAASSEIFGQAGEGPQNERTPFRPRSPYGCAKLYSYWMTTNARDGYGLFAVNGILFNHESPRRGEIFVSRKITRAVARIRHGLQDKLYLGNLDAERDWGYAPEYVEGMWMMLQQAQPDDYVLATEETHSVREFVELAFGHAGLNWRRHVEVDPQYYRPTEIDRLLGDATKAKDAARVARENEIRRSRAHHDRGGRPSSRRHAERKSGTPNVRAGRRMNANTNAAAVRHGTAARSASSSPAAPAFSAAWWCASCASAAAAKSPFRGARSAISAAGRTYFTF